ncbi:uncharacterized protein LAESUDRAFT_719932 [Laetiporus sulphureus 93-53]|uniref:Sensitive to high expression protein 9, mitochondrial n=1 Tax=Laetiporus sulphureus 93-53 TaxID=1314785 RepID=A0A165HNR0_9APHY|nr:uncharacterized protein LAESUDRAFT_719932 [Laetiporus sulphureus 93-53]KZT11980.1 hypothetical protein LAESUDRAFT_719932 [Laetiporus sulphureus 93-53]
MFRTALATPASLCSVCTPSSRSIRLTRHTVHLCYRRVRHISSDPHPRPSTNDGQSDPQPHTHPIDVQQSTTRQYETTTSGGPAVDHLQDIKERLRGWSENAATLLRQHIDEYTAAVAVTFSQLGRELNKVTGYGEIEALKRKVVEQEARIEDVRRAAREAKEAYDKAVLQRAVSQREVNDLLQRKSSWTDEDVIRFTDLVRKEHLREQEETYAKNAAIDAESAVESEFSELLRVILNRYHEEQAWSDKIRSASTYGSLAVVGVNTIVFLLAIILVEPWKRRRLAQTFERKVEQMSTENSEALDKAATELTDRLDGQAQLLSQLVEAVHYSIRVPDSKREILEQTQAVTSTVPEHVLPVLKSNRELVLALATSATIAGIVGWLARSWWE